MAKTFTAQIKAFLELTEQNKRYVAQQSIQDVLEEAQTTQPSVKQTGGSFERGKIPVNKADLVNSLSVNGGAEDADAYVVAIDGYDIGQTMNFTWTSDHALPMELGFTAENGTEVPGRLFVTDAVAQFDDKVQARVAEVKK
ncbi:hypothetical protein [Pseudodonghicola flavimaris]|uniref:HK97 gp10 family phage protein n=1 Tax=Pseudodonghicola flavimaris TaxID=3050036 RepID=A0ABT7EW48_9RHOB|nr:hypothetical protein [Pseudodonghicola flavimaris]MDK3016548.1 hypothetical protein [Pseudodonghicola flavimaris]